MNMDICQAMPEDLPHLYPPAVAALDCDSFSRDLLQEKLFFNPFPGQEQRWTWMAMQEERCCGFMQAIARPNDRQGWLGLFAVDSSARGQGIARRLFEQARHGWVQQGIGQVDVLTVPGNYFTPGVDPRYTPAVCFLEAIGFERTGMAINMRAVLDGDYTTDAAEEKLAGQKVTVRRAGPEDDRLLIDFFQQAFGDGWLAEVRQAMAHQPPGVHIALRDGRIIGFAAHSAMNREWGFFGPMGTLEAARGLGIGRILLYRCMHDLQNEGHRTAIIPWVGPHAFYSKFLNARIERVFWRYRLVLSPGESHSSG